MTEPITWAAVGMAAVANMGTWLVIIRNNNRRRLSPDPENYIKPGTAEICQDRGEKIAVLETKQSRFERDIEEIKNDLKAIREAVVK